jgi:transcriptional regulator with XRE-family HTH domain
MKTIKELRQAKGMSPVQLAAELGVSLATVYNWENRTHEPRASQLWAIARLFGVCMEQIDFGQEVVSRSNEQ